MSSRLAEYRMALFVPVDVSEAKRRRLPVSLSVLRLMGEGGLGEAAAKHFSTLLWTALESGEVCAITALGEFANRQSVARGVAGLELTEPAGLVAASEGALVAALGSWSAEEVVVHLGSLEQFRRVVTPPSHLTLTGAGHNASISYGELGGVLALYSADHASLEVFADAVRLQGIAAGHLSFCRAD